MRASMLQATKGLFQATLTRMGARCSERLLRRLDRTVDYLEVGRWMRAHGFDVSQRVDSRTELFDLVAGEIGDERVLYMEFGVAAGASLRYWSRLLRNPEAMLHGFDSFMGLPERWDSLNEKGQFSTGGNPPAIDDPRVRFVQGWFEDTFPGYRWPAHERLIVNIDADLYSSTRCVLEFVSPKLIPGTFLYFDEFMRREHELKAFDEFLASTGMTFHVRGATRTLAHVLFQRIA